MTDEELKQLWKKDEEMSFHGWNFSYLTGRWKDESLPWDYKKIIQSYLKQNHHLLDMGTGGGEFLLSLDHPRENISVTEAWEPNILLCKEKLAPLGIKVYQVFDGAHLPIEDDSFDIVINRHESFDVKEVHRIIKTGGFFITQQVGGSNNELLSKRLIPGFVAPYPDHCLRNATEELKQKGFSIIYQNEYHPYLRFFDVGAIVYFAKIIEWEFPGFSVDRCFGELLKMHQELKERPYIQSIEHRFIIVAKKII